MTVITLVLTQITHRLLALHPNAIIFVWRRLRLHGTCTATNYGTRLRGFQWHCVIVGFRSEKQKRRAPLLSQGKPTATVIPLRRLKDSKPTRLTGATCRRCTWRDAELSPRRWLLSPGANIWSRS